MIIPLPQRLPELDEIPFWPDWGEMGLPAVNPPSYFTRYQELIYACVIAEGTPTLYRNTPREFEHPDASDAGWIDLGELFTQDPLTDLPACLVEIAL